MLIKKKGPSNQGVLIPSYPFLYDSAVNVGNLKGISVQEIELSAREDQGGDIFMDNEAA